MVDQEEIHNQCLSNDPKNRIHALVELEKFFSIIPDKQQAWEDLHRLTYDEFFYVRSSAAEALGSAFSQLPDKKQAWNDLLRLTSDEDSDVRSSAAEAIGSAFSQLPDKKQVWNDLLKLTNDEDRNVRSRVAYALSSAFSQLPDKKQAWNDLHRLTNDKGHFVRSSAAKAIGSAFSQLPDKKQAWNDLHRLTNDEYNSVRFSAAEALGSAFSQLPDKKQAWNDLHRLTNDEYIFVRSSAAYALGSSFSQLPDKKQAWNDLNRLTTDEESYVRSFSNHSLGRVSIFIASQAETDEGYKKELEKAIKFFEITAKEKPFNNPAQFCLPFYRSFYIIIFKKLEAEEEVDRYLKEAKAAIGGSRNKKFLLEAVENLGNALNEIMNLDNLDLEAKKAELNYYRKYCDRATELMIEAEEATPYATEILRKGLPIFERKLEKIIEQIKEKAKVACTESRGTGAEGIVCEINKEIQNAISDDQRQYIEILEDVVSILKMKIPLIPENIFIFSKIEAIENKKISPEKYRDLPLIISSINTMKVVSDKELKQQLEQQLNPIRHTLGNIYSNTNLTLNEIVYIEEKLSCISFDISKIKLNSADFISDLRTMKDELEKLSKIEGLNTLSIEKLDSMQTEKLNGLNNNILERLDEIKIFIHDFSKDNDELYQEYSRRLDELKQSKLDMLLQRYSAVISLISFAISGIQIAR